MTMVVAPEAEVPVLPYGFAKRFGVVITGNDDAAIHVGLRKGDDPRVLAEVRRLVGRPLAVEIVEAPSFDRLLSGNYALGGFTGGAIDSGDELGLLVDNIPSADDLLDTQDDAPIIRLINGLIAEAARQNVSDIHIEPYETALIVRMRADGQLTERHRLPANVAGMVVSRIKVMARLDIAERRLPQDGRIGLTLGGKSLDVRVSTLPSRAGERVVLRLLDKENAGIDLDALGMPAAIDRVFRNALAEPNGIVLVTGPTGSGKTTTLYAGLRLLNDGSRNILTVEDPVEYAVDGIGQTQVNPKVGLSFATGLRAILRQDPDTVMVGEIRDSETAEIAIQASLTGHLVLSSVHTNDAAGAITRLRDMGIEPFLLASTLRAVVAQRLVRRLCRDCAVPHPATAAEAALIGIAEAAIIWSAAGCPACSNSGYRGRLGVFEAIRITDEIRRLILDGGDESAIMAQAFAGAPALSGAARALVIAGVTTAEESVRVMRSGGDA
ncbi:GspE/PulE family protein [Polymorphobacter fuscus]|uniref:General secretion pathway protein E n=1 Tax=Sandarakinorhabdus fusca TaxID=1439888 RepID=A0A7C9GNA8_9SPHN|nr:ATPase, T2SS/T4P/T4SS family [Polymorphobacter fuscus]KAB7648997.1 type II secretion system protein GspE [Polymorphobacter fuscus]MQT16595.1 type II secretion system protein GspE [Polymorphobacter fuscus]NJC07115.1 general secretion pathway protein E [Polymorphobacter fuscus]